MPQNLFSDPICHAVANSSSALNAVFALANPKMPINSLNLILKEPAKINLIDNLKKTVMIFHGILMPMSSEHFSKYVHV